MRILTFPRTIIALLVVTLTVVSAIAAGITAGTRTTVSGADVTAAKVVRDRSFAQMTAPGTAFTFVDLPGASVTIAVPSRTRAFVMARFAGEWVCSGGSGHCSMRILIRRGSGPFVEMEPAVAQDFDWGINGEHGTGSFDRSSGVLVPGTYTVKVQYGASFGTFHQLDDWSLTVERVRRP